MPSIAVFHPQIVHFAIVLSLVGVLFRLVSLTPWFSFSNLSARTLLLAGAVAATLAVQSGADAHAPVERVPGARSAVQEHEEWGKRARNILWAVAALELIAWGLSGRKAKAARVFTMASAAIGLVAAGAVYEAGEHGGALVYSYAGGIGIRSGEPGDIDNLLVAGLYHGAVNDRAQGRHAEAARLIDELARRKAGDPGIRLLVIESMIKDRADARGALTALDSMHPAADNPRAAMGVGNLRADAYLALGARDSARLVLEALVRDFPQSPRLKARLDSLP